MSLASPKSPTLISRAESTLRRRLLSSFFLVVSTIYRVQLKSKLTCSFLLPGLCVRTSHQPSTSYLWLCPYTFGLALPSLGPTLHKSRSPNILYKVKKSDRLYMTCICPHRIRLALLNSFCFTKVIVILNLLLTNLR